jgi:hypothetical protein
MNTSPKPNASPFPFPTTEHHEPAAPVPQPQPMAPDEASIDHGVAESFPASDPVSVSVTKVPTPASAEPKDEPPAEGSAAKGQA